MIEENWIKESISGMEKDISIIKEQVESQSYIFNHGIFGYKERILNEVKDSPIERLYRKIRNDVSLRFPHRKILEYLFSLYDYDTNSFKEIHFSKIVKECRLGKNKAKEYLEYLIQKRLVSYRTDGYRKFYWIRDDWKG